MRMGIGLGIGINRSNYAQGIFNAYSARVVVDGGVTEAGGCVDAGATSLLQTASLLLIPSGYKGGKLYAEIPTNGNGDLTWTRGSDAFRTNSSGLIQRVPWNLVQYSEEFSNSAWTKSATTLTANTTVAPNGTTTADTLIENTANSSHQIFQSITNVNGATPYTAMIYVKENANRNVAIRIQDAAFTYGQVVVTYNLNTGALISQVATSNGVIVSTSATLTNGYYLIAVSFSINLSTSFRYDVLMVNGTSNSYTGDGTSSIVIWGAQLNIGTTAETYLPTTDRLNFPRLSYMYGSCPSVLLEPQRTNLTLYSAQFDDATWVKDFSSVTANTTTSPDGTTNADTYTGNGSLGAKFTYQTNSVTSGTTYAISVYAKKNTNNFLQINTATASFGVNAWANFNLDSGVVGTVGSSATASIQNVGNGWYRCVITAPAVATGSFASAVFTLITSATSVRSESNTLSTSVFLWGAQLEVGGYSTTYIPTTSATATRVADSASKTGISSLIGQTEGVIFADVYLDIRQSYTYFAIAPNIGSTSTYIGIGFTSTAIIFEVVNSGVQCSIQYSNSATGRFKIAGAYKANDFVLYVNGTQMGTDTSGTVPTCSEIGLFQYSQNQPMRYNQIALFNTRLTNAELASLTTL